MSDHINRTRIKAIYNGLGELKDKVVFVGGATVSLYADQTTNELRTTDDVDVVIEMFSYSEQFALEEKLRQMGFKNDYESGVICRYIYKGFIVDIMPVNNDWLGFKNKWYPDGYANSILYEMDENYSVKIFSPPYFIASKLEAFKSRGKSDGRTSHDFGDIVYLFENRSTIWQELAFAPDEVKKYLLDEFNELHRLKYFSEWIGAHLDSSSMETPILSRLKEFLVAD